MVSLSVDRQSIQCWETHRHNRPHAPFSATCALLHTCIDPLINNTFVLVEMRGNKKTKERKGRGNLFFLRLVEQRKMWS